MSAAMMLSSANIDPRMVFNFRFHVPFLFQVVGVCELRSYEIGTGRPY